MSSIRSYRDLDAWMVSVQLAKECYRLTGQFPRSEQFGLGQQLRRAAVSVPSNIAEGNGSRRRQPYIHHLNIALGSLAEVETHLVLAAEFGFVSPNAVATADELATHAGRLLLALVRSLESVAS
ncbi:MAG: four helix bundle protein [Vicinamibacterales bacterium]